MQVIGMHIGASFAEVCIWDSKSKRTKARKLFYLPRQNLRTHLPPFLEAHAEPGFEAAYITSRYLQRLCEFRLGGGIAHVTTAGFEDWAALSNHGLKSPRAQGPTPLPITATELSFGLNERIEADGRITKKLDPAELESIARQLKAKDIKKVCVHLLHAPANDLHHKQSVSWFREHGFEVFEPDLSIADETVRWRTNTLEACFSGTQDELLLQLQQGFEKYIPPEKVFMHDHEGFKPAAQAARVGTIFGLDRVLSNSLGNNDGAVVYDLEEWYVLHKNKTAQWESPWGTVCCERPLKNHFPLQPSNRLDAIPGVALQRAPNEGFEPGPVLLGRGQKLMVLDAWFDSPEMKNEFTDLITETALTRCQSQFTALARTLQYSPADKLHTSVQKDVAMINDAFVGTQNLSSPVFLGMLHLDAPKMTEGFLSERVARAGWERRP